MGFFTVTCYRVVTEPVTTERFDVAADDIFVVRRRTWPTVYVRRSTMGAVSGLCWLLRSSTRRGIVGACVYCDE